MTNRVRVEIFGSKYIIDTPEEEAYIHSLAKEINDTAVAMQQRDPHLSPNNIMALCALASTDSYHKSEQACDNLRAQLTQYLEDASSARSELARLQRELDETKRELERQRRHNEISDKLSGGNA